MTITLIGFRGVGKSSVGPQLAARLGSRCIDADTEIVARAGMSIADIFAQHGEPHFRRLEANVIAELLQSGNCIVATGGGAVLHDATRERMRQAGPVIWLQASPETIWSRIGESLGGSRPSLTDLDPRQEIESLLQQRLPVYDAAATITIPTDGRTVTAIVDEIESLLPPQPEWPE